MRITKILRSFLFLPKVKQSVLSSELPDDLQLASNKFRVEPLNVNNNFLWANDLEIVLREKVLSGYVKRKTNVW